jgi:hypothetical protein
MSDDIVKVHVRFAQPADASNGDNLMAVFECTDKMGAPSMPFWPLPLLDGDVVLVNMAMVLFARVEKGKVKLSVPGA